MRFPGFLDEALGQWLAGQEGSLAEATRGLAAAYRKGENSSRVSLAAYVATRVPATFAANVKVHEALAGALPEFAPQSLLDIGTGPGTASWAALAAWPGIARVTQCEQDADFAALAASLNASSGLAALQQGQLMKVAENRLAADVTADLVVASYMLAEMPLEVMPLVAQRLWARAGQVLVLIEPGTPQGFARLRAVRDTLLKRQAVVIAPCTHQWDCPMAGTDWCHFNARVQRSREHMHAKQATVPFEDEAFSYLVLAKAPLSPSAPIPLRDLPQQVGEGKAALPQLVGAAARRAEGGRGAEGGRVIAPVVINKVAAVLRLCKDGAVEDTTVASRDKPAYKRAKKTQWGDVWE